MRNKLSLFIVLLILINMITLSTMNIPSHTDKQQETNIEYTEHGYFVYDVWFPLFENNMARSRGLLTLNNGSNCVFPTSICRIKDRWSELLYA